MKRIIKTFIILLVASSLPVAASAHPGGTDGAGGHTNRSTGEYHYHHGYSAHQHYDMDGDGEPDCPYDFKDNTDSKQSESDSGGKNYFYEPPEIQFETPTTEYTIPITTYSTKPPGSKIDTSGMPAIIKTDKDDESMIPPVIIWALVILSVTVIAMYIYIRRKNDEHGQIEWRFSRDYEELKAKYDKTASALKAAEFRISLYEKERKDEEERIYKAKAMQEKLDRLTEEIDSANLQYLDVLKVNAVEDISLDDLKKMVRRHRYAPKDVTFAKDGLPVHWNTSYDKPYGDYTVYMSLRSSVYHTNRYCSSYYNHKEHIFNVIDKYRPCKKCAMNAFPFSTTPDWYWKCK